MKHGITIALLLTVGCGETENAPPIDRQVKGLSVEDRYRKLWDYPTELTKDNTSPSGVRYMEVGMEQGGCRFQVWENGVVVSEWFSPFNRINTDE